MAESLLVISSPISSSPLQDTGDDVLKSMNNQQPSSTADMTDPFACFVPPSSPHDQGLNVIPSCPDSLRSNNNNNTTTTNNNSSSLATSTTSSNNNNNTTTTTTSPSPAGTTPKLFPDASPSAPAADSTIPSPSTCSIIPTTPSGNSDASPNNNNTNSNSDLKSMDQVLQKIASIPNPSSLSTQETTNIINALSAVFPKDLSSNSLYASPAAYATLTRLVKRKKRSTKKININKYTNLIQQKNMASHHHQSSHSHNINSPETIAYITNGFNNGYHQMMISPQQHQQQEMLLCQLQQQQQQQQQQQHPHHHVNSSQHIHSYNNDHIMVPSNPSPTRSMHSNMNSVNSISTPNNMNMNMNNYTPNPTTTTPTTNNQQYHGFTQPYTGNNGTPSTSTSNGRFHYMPQHTMPSQSQQQQQQQQSMSTMSKSIPQQYHYENAHPHHHMMNPFPHPQEDSFLDPNQGSLELSPSLTSFLNDNSLNGNNGDLPLNGDSYDGLSEMEGTPVELTRFLALPQTEAARLIGIPTSSLSPIPMNSRNAPIYPPDYLDYIKRRRI